MAQILVIDDDDQVRTLFRMILERAGYQVEEAADGRSGARKFRENPADLIITDIIMPEQEGIQTILELRRDFPDVKIIAISGGGTTPSGTYLDLANRLGARRTFSKPIKRQQLLDAVEQVLAGES